MTVHGNNIAKTYPLNWQGPFVLQGTQGKLLFDSPAATKSGIYILTVEYRNGYLIYAAGKTTRPFRQRFREHIREYRSGTYTILDTKGFPSGERIEMWHGMFYKKETNTPAMKANFESRRKKLNPAIEKLLSTFRIFVAPLRANERVHARIEASIMNMLYSSKKPFSSLPDKGMSLAPRREREKPFLVKSMAKGYLHCLPKCFKA